MLRYNDTITRIQDLQGKLNRKTLLYHGEMEPNKRDFIFEVENMRQAGIKNMLENKTKIYFKFRSLNEIILETMSLGIKRDFFDLEENYFDNKEKIKVSFESKKDVIKGYTQGYYIIDAQNWAILEFYLNATIADEFTEKADFKYRTTKTEKNLLFNKDASLDKYVLKNAKIKHAIEVTDSENSFQSVFESEYILKSSGHFSAMKVNKNVNANKDIFKLNFPYDKSFWDTQNQLLLTNEMLFFIKGVGKENQEFDIKSNLR